MKGMNIGIDRITRWEDFKLMIPQSQAEYRQALYLLRGPDCVGPLCYVGLKNLGEQILASALILG